MKVKVIKKFRDKYTNDLHEINTILEVTNKRLEEMNSTAYGILVEAVAEIDYTSYTKKELIEMAEEKGVNVNPKMTKAEIIGELIK